MSFQTISPNRYICKSTDTKLTALVNPGATCYEENTGYMFIFNGYAWIPKSTIPDQTINYKQISLNQAANTYDVMTATAQSLFIDAVIISIPDDLSAVATFSSVAVQTDDVSPITIMASSSALKAALTGNFYYVYRGPVVTAATKKIQLTIGGATAGAGSEADITVFWRPLVAGGYMLNA